MFVITMYFEGPKEDWYCQLCHPRKIKNLLTYLHKPPPPEIRYRPFQGGGSDVVLCRLFWCQSFGDVLPYVCYTFSSVLVAEWPPFGK